MRIRTVVRVHTRLLLLSCRMQTWRCVRSSTSCACCDSTGSSPARVCKRISSHPSVFLEGLGLQGFASLACRSICAFVRRLYRCNISCAMPPEPCRGVLLVSRVGRFDGMYGMRSHTAPPRRRRHSSTCAVAVVSLRTGSAAVAVHLGAFRNCG
jgi:hypothetical protein